MTERGVNYTTALRLMLEDQQAKREHEAKSAEPKTYLGVRIHAGEDEG